jgi:hypothetical protein
MAASYFAHVKALSDPTVTARPLQIDITALVNLITFSFLEGYTELSLTYGHPCRSYFPFLLHREIYSEALPLTLKTLQHKTRHVLCDLLVA